MQQQVASAATADAALAKMTLEEEGKRKKRLWALGLLGFFGFISVGTYVYNEYYIYLSVYLWFGLIYGMCLQYGRFCFSSAFRDLFAIKVPRMLVGIVIATLLFGIVSAPITAIGMSTFHAAPVSSHAIIAGIFFGVGMVIAGGCASSSLYKTGEGNMNALLVILSLSLTQALFADVGGWANNLVPDAWAQSALEKGLPASINVSDGWVDQYLAGYVWNQPAVTYAEVLGMSNASVSGAFLGNLVVGILIPAALLLALVYVLYWRKGYRNKQQKAGKDVSGFKGELAGYWSMIIANKRTAIAGLILGIACALQMLVIQGLRVKFGFKNAGVLLDRIGWDFGLSVQGTVFDPGYWYVTTQEAQWVGWTLQKMGIENMDNIYFGFVNGIPNPAINPADWMSFALIGGAAIIALYHNEFKFKKPTWETAMWSVIGGFFMGIGARLGLGCNVGAFFVRVANGDCSGWLFGLGMAGGAYLGVKFFNWWTEKKLAKEMESCGL
ncbi:MAG: YeeE/YedE family protein [Gammaproteobacteria bacterium]|nr:YeeE/YedE family protein [Gammaproteobacteria bacterium]